MQLSNERAVIALGFHLIRGKLQLLQASVNILYIISPYYGENTFFPVHSSSRVYLRLLYDYVRDGPLFFYRGGGGEGYHFWDLQTVIF